MSEMNLLLECEVCKNRFSPSESEVNHKKEFKSNGQSIFLTYYDCPQCGKRHFVQIDDEISLQKLVKVKNEFVKLAAMRKNDKEIPKKLSEKFKKSRQHLADYRMNLMKEYTDKTVTDVYGVEYILRFSIWT